MEKMLKNKNIQNILVGLFLIVVMLAPRIQKLGYYATADEPKYVKQSAGFYLALTNGDFAKTNRIIHPGVIPLWLGAASFAWQFPEYSEVGDDNIADLNFRMLLRQNGLSTAYMLAAARAMMILAHTGLLVGAFLLSRRLWGLWPALLGVVLIGFDPFYFAHSRLMVTDGLLSVLMFVSLIAYLVYIKEKQRWALVVSAIAAAASWLTKVPGILMVPTVFILISGDYVRRVQRKSTLLVRPELKRALLDFLAWSAILVLASFVMWPALWVDAPAVISKIVDFTAAQSTAEIISPLFFNGEQVKTGIFGLEYFYYYPLTFLWRTTPVALIGLAGLGFGAVRKQEWLRQHRFEILALLGLALFYTLVITISKKKFDRYLLPAFLPLDMLAALGWLAWIKGLSDWFSAWGQKNWRYVVVSVAALLQAAAVYQTFPYYLSYYNPLMGGSAEATEVMLVGWGEGLDEAARYLNEKPQSNQLHVFTHYSFVLDYYFNGVSTKMSLYLKPAGVEMGLMNSDYVVVYVNHEQRGIYEPFFDVIGDAPPEHTIWIDGIEYVRIYNMEEIRQGQ